MLKPITNQLNVLRCPQFLLIKSSSSQVPCSRHLQCSKAASWVSRWRSRSSSAGLGASIFNYIWQNLVYSTTSAPFGKYTRCSWIYQIVNDGNIPVRLYEKFTNHFQLHLGWSMVNVDKSSTQHLECCLGTDTFGVGSFSTHPFMLFSLNKKQSPANTVSFD